MAIERRLTEVVGPLGGKLHTGRSRNDQVATDLALYVRDHAVAGQAAGRRADGAAARARRAPRRLADARLHAPAARPAGLPRATTCSPTSGCWSATPGASRAARESAGELPLGSGALAGLNWDLDRRGRRPRARLRFGWSPNSIDAVSNRDFVLDYLAAASICAMHLSRLGAEIVLWSSDEFSFCEVGEDFSSGSSIMPQKKNPDAAELLRAKAPRICVELPDPRGRHARPAARLLEGPPGGQGGAIRRGRQPRALPRGRGADARGPELRS